eukprot:scaffold17661_cov17-Tisochrysis_lutea.AAC.2
MNHGKRHDGMSKTEGVGVSKDVQPLRYKTFVMLILPRISPYPPQAGQTKTGPSFPFMLQKQEKLGQLRT